MQVNSVVNKQIIQNKQNFKQNPASTDVSGPPNSIYKPISSTTVQAYFSSPLASQSYKEIDTFEVPYVGQGKVYELTNGHKVAIIQKPGPFAIDTCVKTDLQSDNVISHFVEHLVYDSELKIDNETFSHFLRSQGIDSNATTSLDYVNYWMKYPFDDKETIERIIRTQAKILQEPKDFKTKIERERGILVSEAIIRAEENANPDENIPRYIMMNYLLGLNEQPKPQINEIDEIENITPEKLEQFYSKYYDNSNMITFIVGDIKPEETIKIFARYFNKPSNTARMAHKENKQVLSNPAQQAKRFDVNVNSMIEKNIQVGFVGPQNDNLYEGLLSMALKIYINDIRGNEKLEYGGISTESSALSDSVEIMSARAEKGQEGLVLNNIYKYADKLAQTPISDDDFNALKIKLKEYFSLFSESARATATIGAKGLLYSNKIDMFEYSKLVDKLTKEDIQNFAKKYLDLNKAAVVIVHENPPTDKASKPSFMGSKTSIDTSNIKEYQYPDTNLQLVVDTSPAITRTSFKLDFISDKIPNSNPAALNVLSYMLISNFENYISRYHFISDSKLESRLNKLSLTATCLPEYSKDLINIIKFNLLNPPLTQEELDKAKKILKQYKKITYSEFLAAIKNAKYEGYNYAGNAINRLSIEEFSKVIDSITLHDVVDLHKQITSNSQGKAFLVIPKDIFDSQKQGIFDSINSNMPKLMQKQNIDLVKMVPVIPVTKTKVITKVIDDDNATIEQDFRIPQSGDMKDDICVKLLEILIGVQKGSRLKSEIRDKRGLSYATGALYETDGRLGYLSLISHLPLNKDNSQNLKDVLAVFRKNTNDLINNPITPEELELAKITFKSQIVQDLEHSETRNSLISQYGLEGLKSFYKILDQVTPYDIQNVSKKFLNKPSIIIVSANKDVIDANKDILSVDKISL